MRLWYLIGKKVSIFSFIASSGKYFYYVKIALEEMPRGFAYNGFKIVNKVRLVKIITIKNQILVIYGVIIHNFVPCII